MSETVQSPQVTAWTSRAFLAEVDPWVRKEATAAGIGLTGEWEQPHARPWSSALRYGAVGGDVWFKVNGPGTAHEGALTAVLAGLEPSLLPQVVATDPSAGWTLFREAGPVMRSHAPPEGLWDAWGTVLSRYAAAQVRLAEHEATILATGVPERSPRTLPGQLRTLADELLATPVEEGGISAGEHERLGALLDEYDTWCEDLASSGVPSSIQHDDLHSGNVCWDTSPAAARIIDWGDASWGCPLGTLLVTMSSLAWHARCEVDDPRVQRARDAYLEPFTGYADRRALLDLVDLARRTGCVTRALSYRAALVGEPVSTHAEHDFPVRGWLLELLER